MTTGSFQVYNRGFLGRMVHEAPPPQKPYVATMPPRLQYDANVFQAPPPHVTINSAVEELYAQYTKIAANVNSFEFHQRVLQEALRAFGTASFLEWVYIQKNSPTVSYLHSKFLIDTIQFIRTGKRSMLLETWEILLTNPVKTTEWEDAHSHALALKNEGYHTGVRDIILHWCQQPGGIVDLLTTLHVLFGD